jgi:hypothetical protein
MAPVIKQLIAEGKTRDEVIAEAARRLGVDEAEARLIYAIETGAIAGDVIAVDADGMEGSGYPPNGYSILRRRDEDQD